MKDTLVHLRLRPIVSTAALLAVLAVPGVAFAQANEAEAKVHYQKGVELYNESAYTAALDELEKAYALSPHFRILYSLALVRAQLSDVVGALRSFQEYEAAAVDESPARKAEVRERIDALQQKVANIQVKVNVEDAEVYVDDQLKGTSPFDKPILVNPGKHTLYAKKGTVKSELKAVTLGAATSTRIAFDLDVQGSAKDGGTQKNAPNENQRPKWLLPSWIAAGTFAAGAVVTGIVALSKADELKTAREGTPRSSGDLDDLRSSAKTWGLVTDILIVPAVALTAVNLYFTIRYPSSSNDSASPGIRSQLQVGLGRVSIGGTF